MKKFFSVLILAFSLTIYSSSFSQVVIQSQCPNTDFSLLNFTNWEGCYCPSGSACYSAISSSGTVPNCTPLLNPSFNCGTTGFLTTATAAQPSLHTILTPANTSYYNASSPSLTGLYDSLTNYGLRKIPAGVSQVCRLNSWKTGYQTSQLAYTMTVDTNVSGLFVYSYAVVLQNPSHPCNQQPYFHIRLTNANGVPITNPCGSFTFVAGTPGAFINHTTVGSLGNIDWFNWQTVGLSLKPYHGQTIKIQFIAADCGQGGHFGYAYFYGYCVPRQIAIAYCPGSFSAKLTAPNGFKYKWIPSGDTTQSITVVGPVDSTVYKVVIQSLFNTVCSDTLSAMLLPNIVNSNFTFSNECVNVPVNFTRTTTSNTAIYNWFWNFGDPGTLGNHLIGLQTPSHTYTTPGTYTVTLIDSLISGCPDTIQKVITVYPNPVLNVTGDSVCIGDSAKITVSGASTYLWSNGVTNSTQYVSPTSSTDYKIIGTSSNNCVDSSFAYVHIFDKPQISFLADTLSGCDPITTNFINLTDPPNSTYLWDFGDNTTSTLTDPSHVYHAGQYSISLKATSPEGCVDVSIVPNLINVYPMPHPDFTWSPPVGLINSPVTFTNLTLPANNTFSYIWDFGNGQTMNFGVGDVFSLYSSPGFYNVSLIGYTDNGCMDSIKHQIQIVNDSLTFPNIITPNGDNKNDKFVIVGLLDGGYPENSLIIYNRWGKKVYSKDNYMNDFDGEGLADGTYFFVFKAKGIIREVDYKGSLTILR